MLQEAGTRSRAKRGSFGLWRMLGKRPKLVCEVADHFRSGAGLGIIRLCLLTLLDVEYAGAADLRVTSRAPVRVPSSFEESSVFLSLGGFPLVFRRVSRLVATIPARSRCGRVVVSILSRAHRRGRSQSFRVDGGQR